MDKIKYLVLLLVVVAFAFQPVMASPDLVPAHNSRAHVPVNLVIPAHAIEVADGVFDLGFTQDIDGRPVHGYAFVYYHKNYAKPDNPGGNGKGNGNGGGGDTSDPAASCYDFMAKGARWKTTEPYVVASDVDSSAVARDFNAWDSQVSSFDIIGNEDTTSTVDGADAIATDGKNEIMFGNIESDGAIAVAIVWGRFSGNPAWRELVEYDVIFDNVDYAWGDGTVDPSVMDFENIATHEFGHAAGVADLYNSDCAEQTMYGYADYGETNKRTLEVGDINGITELYK